MGYDSKGVQSDEGRPRRRRILLAPLVVVLVGIVVVVLALLPFINAVEASEYWHEDYLDDGEFVIHGRISYEGRPMPDPKGKWVFRLEEKVAVDSDYDLGDEGDEVYFRCEALDFVLPDENAVKTRSGALSYPPTAGWVGVVLVVVGVVLLVVLRLRKG